MKHSIGPTAKMGVRKKLERDKQLVEDDVHIAEIRKVYLSTSFNQIERHNQLQGCVTKAALAGSAKGLAFTLVFKAAMAQITQACEALGSDPSSGRPEPLLIKASLPAAVLCQSPQRLKSELIIFSYIMRTLAAALGATTSSLSTWACRSS